MTVDDGAARALRDGGTSLLPVGIVDVRRRVRRRRGGRGPRRHRRRDRQGDLQLLGRRAAAGDGHEVGRGARDAPARGRGGGPPGLLRARLDALAPSADGRSPPTRSVTDICLAAKAAARASSRGRARRSRTRRCCAIADALVERTPEILEANARDLEAGRESGLSDALMDRLALDAARVRGDRRGRARDRRAARTRSAR